MSGSVPDAILEVRDLRVHFPTDDGLVRAVDGVSFRVLTGETLGIVGESGSGKTVTFMTIMGLVSRKDAHIEGEVIFQGRDLLQMSPEELRRVRGDKIAIVFQDPLTALNPVMKVGSQIVEMIRTHREVPRKAAWDQAVELLARVGIPQPRERARQYPHEFSGGMRQRATIAMALSLDPDILIADEPTTALDVTVQAQILELIDGLKREFRTSVVLITHDLGVVAQYADTVQVMYAGKITEAGPREDIYYDALHPYTWGLLNSISHVDEDLARLRPIAGSPPSLISVPPGCSFHPRCPHRFDRCDREIPPLIEEEPAHLAACYLPVEEKKRIFATQVAVRR